MASTHTVAGLASSGDPRSHYAPAHLSGSLPWSYLFALPLAAMRGGALPSRAGGDGDAVDAVDAADLHHGDPGTASGADPGQWLDAFQAHVERLGTGGTGRPAVPVEEPTSDQPRVRELPSYVTDLLRRRAALGAALQDRGEPDDRYADDELRVPQATWTLVLDVVAAAPSIGLQ